jgi:hypothetical protein
MARKVAERWIKTAKLPSVLSRSLLEALEAVLDMALRPTLIFGPVDTALVVVTRSRFGREK